MAAPAQSIGQRRKWVCRPFEPLIAYRSTRARSGDSASERSATMGRRCALREAMLCRLGSVRSICCRTPASTGLPCALIVRVKPCAACGGQVHPAAVVQGRADGLKPIVLQRLVNGHALRLVRLELRAAPRPSGVNHLRGRCHAVCERAQATAWPGRREDAPARWRTSRLMKSVPAADSCRTRRRNDSGSSGSAGASPSSCTPHGSSAATIISSCAWRSWGSQKGGMPCIIS